MSRIILITGGQRSGKSSKAEELALQLSAHPVYVATAHIWDDEFRERVRRHQERRGPCWTNIEEEKYLSRHDLTGRVIVIDCITLWLTNFFFETSDVQQTLEAAKSEFDRFTANDATYIFVTNEIGSGGTSDNAHPATVHRPSGLDEPVHRAEGQRGHPHGQRHSRQDKINDGFHG